MQQTETFQNPENDWLLQELPPQYELLGQLRKGAMGSIFKARNRYTNADVAIKIILAESAQNTTTIQRFFLEAKATSLLKHHNICRVLDFGVSKSGMPYLVMDWIEGVDLEKKVEEAKQLSLKEAMPIFKQVAEALAHAHQKNIIHRDLKPENVMVSKNADDSDEVHLVDFGIAKMLGNDGGANAQALTRVGLAVGTPAYMSPEQVTGSAVDIRTDIYSLGCLMYFVLNGKTPFYGTSARQVLEKQLRETPPAMDSALNIPAPVQAVVYKAMNKVPAQRYANMTELLSDLEWAQRPPVPTLQTVKDTTLKSKLFWPLSFVIGFAIAYFVGYIIYSFSEASVAEKHTAVISDRHSGHVPAKKRTGHK